MSLILVRARNVAAVVILAWLVARTLLVTMPSKLTSVRDRIAKATMISISVKPDDDDRFMAQPSCLRRRCAAGWPAAGSPGRRRERGPGSGEPPGSRWADRRRSTA